MKDEKETTQAKPVEAILVAVLEDKPKGETLGEVKRVIGNEFGGKFANQAFKLPQGPALINGQWVWITFTKNRLTNKGLYGTLYYD